MSRAFLSHSSKDKKNYVAIVAEKLGLSNCIYDEFTFEEGMKPIEEIEKSLNKTDVFVIFISDAALNSKWVKLELDKAQKLLDKNIKRIYPIIIDSTINYYDKRIPSWMRKEYNLKPISRPTIAAQRIRQRLREISWQQHPDVADREKIFVGRNNLVKIFEERVDNLDIQKPVCVIASGLDKIGRQALLRFCLKKTGIIEESYKPAIITLDSHESIEDFILKINDLGFSKVKVSKNFLKKKVVEKVAIAVNIIKDIQKTRELIFIYDNGCVVTPDGNISEWYKSILEGIENKEIIFGVASIFRVLKSTIRYNNNVFTIDVPELDKKERDGLLRRYAEMRGLHLSSEDLNLFAAHLNGYPEQVFHAINLIEDLGLNEAKQNVTEVRDFVAEKVSKLLARIEKKEKALEFLCFLSKFEFISYNLIFNIVGDEEIYHELLNRFIISAMCEYLGANKEYLRVNYAIRDYLSRNQFALPKIYHDRMKEHVKNFLADYMFEERDISDYIFSIKEALISNKNIDFSYLVPSHFLKTMVALYNNRKYSEVIVLADRVLQNAEYIDREIQKEIRYYLCLSLARLQSDINLKDRFLREVMEIQGADHDFLFGFFYRLSDNSIKAIERLESAIAKRPRFSRAKRELVQVYLHVEEYDKALELARMNYENDKNNAYHIHAYIRCLIRSEKDEENEKMIIELLDRLEKINSQKAIEMFYEVKSQYLCFYKNDGINALSLIDNAIDKIPDSIYFKITKFTICEKFDWKPEMKKVLASIEKETVNSVYFNNYYLTLKAVYLAREGKKSAALSTLNSLVNYPETSIQKLKVKINRICNGNHI